MLVNVVKIMCTLIVLMSSVNIVIAIDIRKFGLEFPHNKQDDHKNTFWHNLACECENFEDWSEVEKKMKKFKKNNKYWLPNPLIENENDKTAKQEAEASYKKSGNPVCAWLVIRLNEIEKGYLSYAALKANRDMMSLAQHVEHPDK